MIRRELKTIDLQSKEFGGELRAKRRKIKRPLDPKKPAHFVLRLKQNLPSFFSPRRLIAKNGFLDLAAKYNIKVYHLVFNHSHCHACLLIPAQKGYVDFVRELTSWLTAYFSKVANAQLKRIFLHRPYTRIVEWGRSFKILMKYFEKNEQESGVSQPKSPKTQAKTSNQSKVVSTQTQLNPQLSFDFFDTG